ncbi:hypothetical protein SAMN05421823_10219 [Catalinimonas alkaloidigena]|uniref:Uncharacterized protein n=1 Tax=Catalinimonas alkaloidigena TaxID=1075417 RepID=A0A1G8ZKZ3_9BACT|nr:hypothetical protein [Catalinimonas alkaloidigena]SDK15708.1 hypothetical protein SAMN05421823_10219 [Catalinimonas alkaloidigena]
MPVISKKKPSYKIQPPLHHYLHRYGRAVNLPVTYDDLRHYAHAFPLMDRKGQDTLWETVTYDPQVMRETYDNLKMTYSLLKTDGDTEMLEHLYIERVDYCTFGNSNPFRVRIVNQFNDNYDHFYVKRADASRIYGLELEHILSPNRINYLVKGDTLIEEHIAGVPGDDFIKDYLKRPALNQVRLAKEFVKFNERCFVRLLGDMRSYNYVVDITPDFEEEQYRVRPIDFDQQSYDGRRSMYLPQYFKDNNPIVELCLARLNMKTIRQYQYEERTLIFRRLKAARYRLKELIDAMRKDRISTPEHLAQLRRELNRHYGTDQFDKCRNMGDLVRLHLKVSLKKIHPNQF